MTSLDDDLDDDYLAAGYRPVPARNGCMSGMLVVCLFWIIAAAIVAAAVQVAA